jgi:type III secretion protein D
VNAAVSMTAASALVLRVLNGRLKGAEHRLHAGKYIRVGHSFDHDVVLRGNGTNGASAELHLLDDIATIKMVAGQAILLGRPIAAGEEAHLPFFVPVSIGEYTIAVGDAQADRWTEAEALMASMGPIVTTTPDDDASPPMTTQANALERAATRLSPLREWFDTKPNWPKLGIFAAIALFVLAAIGPVWSWLDDSFRGPDQAQSVLKAAGYPGLHIVRDDGNHRLVVQGTLRTDADLAKLRSFVATNFDTAIVDVETTEAHAAAATEILTSQGIDAQAKPVATGTLLIDGEFLPQDKQIAVRKMLQGDLPAVKTIRFKTNDARGERGLQYFFASTEFGIATVIEGDPSYILTADGTRWFVGATVPTGHKILSIGSDRISFEREGRVDELVL